MAKRQGQMDYSATPGASIGDNSQITADDKIKLGGFVSEIERIRQELRDLSSELGLIYKSAKEQGFNTRALKRLVRDRMMDPQERDAMETAVDTYRHALGDFATTPLGAVLVKQQEAAK